MSKITMPISDIFCLLVPGAAGRPPTGEGPKTAKHRQALQLELCLEAFILCGCLKPTRKSTFRKKVVQYSFSVTKYLFHSWMHNGSTKDVSQPSAG